MSVFHIKDLDDDDIHYLQSLGVACDLENINELTDEEYSEYLACCSIYE